MIQNIGQTNIMIMRQCLETLVFNLVEHKAIAEFVIAVEKLEKFMFIQ